MVGRFGHCLSAPHSLYHTYLQGLLQVVRVLHAHACMYITLHILYYIFAVELKQVQDLESFVLRTGPSFVLKCGPRFFLSPVSQYDYIWRLGGMCKIANSVNWRKISVKKHLVRISKSVFFRLVCAVWVAVFHVDLLEKMKQEKYQTIKQNKTIKIVFLVWSSK